MARFTRWPRLLANRRIAGARGRGSTVDPPQTSCRCATPVDEQPRPPDRGRPEVRGTVVSCEPGGSLKLLDLLGTGDYRISRLCAHPPQDPPRVDFFVNAFIV